MRAYLANAKVIRLLVVIILVVAKRRQTRGKLRFKQEKLAHTTPRSSITYMIRQIAPALFLVALNKICNRGPAEELMTSSMFPATKSSTVRKTKPVNVPMATHPIITFGPSTAALGISG